MLSKESDKLRAALASRENEEKEKEVAQERQNLDEQEKIEKVSQKLSTLEFNLSDKMGTLDEVVNRDLKGKFFLPSPN